MVFEVTLNMRLTYRNQTRSGMISQRQTESHEKTLYFSYKILFNLNKPMELVQNSNPCDISIIPNQSESMYQRRISEETVEHEYGRHIFCLLHLLVIVSGIGTSLYTRGRESEGHNSQF